MKKKLQKNSLPQTADNNIRSSGGLRVSSWVWLSILSFVLAILAYSNGLRGDFVFDDLGQVFSYPNASKLPFSVWVNLTRPLTALSFWINYRLGGADPAGYHWVNLAVHFLNAVLVTLIVRRLAFWNGLAGGRYDFLAVFCAMVFLLNPIQTEAVTYVTSRSEVLAVGFLWAGFAYFLYRKRSSASWLDGLIIIFLFLCSCLCKEYSVVFPGLLILADYYWNPGFSLSGLQSNWRLYGIMTLGALGGGLLAVKILLASATAGFGLIDLTAMDYFRTQCKVIWLYIFKFVLPLGQTVDYDIPITRTWADPLAIFGLAGLMAATGAAFHYRKQYRLASYGWLIFLILLAPTSSLLPIRDVCAERRLYLPSLGLLLIALDFLSRIRWTRVTQAVLLFTALGYLILTDQRNAIWSSPEALWRDAVAKSPNKSRPHFQLGRILYAEGRFDGAVAEYAAAARTGGLDYTLLLNWGIALDDAGRQGEALEKLNQAATVHPDPYVYAELGRLYGRAKQNDKALAMLEQVQRLAPDFEMGYVYRGNVYLNMGDRSRAIEQYNRALSINPSSDSALEGLRIANQNRR